jgi:hypothetical protein
MKLSEVLLNISKMNSNELNSVIDMVNRTRSFQISQVANSFHVGDKVYFKNRQGRKVRGVVAKVNPKNIKVKTEQGVWNVTATLLKSDTAVNA